MNDYKIEGTESNSNHNDGFKNDAERDDDIKELELTFSCIARSNYEASSNRKRC